MLEVSSDVKIALLATRCRRKDLTRRVTGLGCDARGMKIEEDFGEKEKQEEGEERFSAPGKKQKGQTGKRCAGWLGILGMAISKR